jgi:hypothetical protein
MNITLKTGYEWCLEANMRILNISSWDTQWALYEESYYEEKIDLKEFYRRIELCKVKPNSMPRKTEMYLEYRMYGMVPYNMSPIQQGIQFGHAVVDYGRNIRDVNTLEKIYNKWADKDKTFIILNGGTTNNNPDRLGTLNKHLNSLNDAGIIVQSFCEPDLGDQLTAIVFLVDERVFNKTPYPDFTTETLPWSRNKPSEKQISELEAKNIENYKHWVEKIGGEKNVFLREYLKPLRLA